MRSWTRFLPKVITCFSELRSFERKAEIVEIWLQNWKPILLTISILCAGAEEDQAPTAVVHLYRAIGPEKIKELARKIYDGIFMEYALLFGGDLQTYNKFFRKV